MSIDSPTSVPAGWYPDPSGAPQWRVWNGRDWSTVTKRFDSHAPVPAPPVASTTLDAVYWLRVLGVPTFFSGLALLLGTFAHWPGTAHPTSSTWAVVSGTLAIGLLAFATILGATAVRALQGYWSLDAFLPGINLLSVNVLARRTLGMATFGPPPLVEALVVVVACVGFHDPLVPLLLLGSMARSYLLRLRFVHEALSERAR